MKPGDGRRLSMAATGATISSRASTLGPMAARMSASASEPRVRRSFGSRPAPSDALLCGRSEGVGKSGTDRPISGSICEDVWNRPAEGGHGARARDVDDH